VSLISNVERLGQERADTTSFFAFARLQLVARAIGTNELSRDGDQVSERANDQASQIRDACAHLDEEAFRAQQEALGIVSKPFATGGVLPKFMLPEELVESLPVILHHTSHRDRHA